MNRQTVFLSLLILSLFFCRISHAEVSEGIGSISSMEGIADISRSGGDKILLKESDTVNIKDRIRTKSYSKVEITFRDKSVVKIAPNSCITVDEYILSADNKRESAKIMLSRGKIEAVVSRTGRPETFVINTPNATGSVKGSDIFVSYQAGNTGFLVKEGMLSVLSQVAPGTKIDVGKGDCTFVRPDKAPEEARPYYDADMSTYKKEVSPTLIKKWVSYKGTTQMTAAIVSATGKVLVYKKGAQDWRPANLNEVILEGDKIQTTENGYVEIRLGNGNALILNAGTELVFTKLAYNPDTKEYENVFSSDRGKIKAIIEKLGKTSTFQVKTPIGVCGARGTIMYLDITKEATRVAYEGGGGIITSTVTNMTQMVEAGQNSAIDSAGVISAPVYTSTEQKASLDSSFSEKGEVAGYSAPSTAVTQGSTTLHSGTGVGAAALSGGAPVNGDRIFSDNPPFDSVHPTPVNTVTTIYSTTLNLTNTTDAAIQTAQSSINFLSNNTWTSTISGTYLGAPGASFDLTLKNATSTDIVYIDVTGWSGDGTWSATIPSSSETSNPSMRFSGTASGTYDSVKNFSGTGSGTSSSN